jgi:gliding motility-associated-like protein
VPHDFSHRFVILCCLLTLLYRVSNAQVADFSADITSGCFPLTVNFSDASTGSPTGWAWDFGNGNSSPLQNPSAVFSAPGLYTVKLTVTKGGASNTKTVTAFIKVYGPPDVNFSFDRPTGCAPLTVRFQDLTSATSGAITNWFWTFGDGGTSQSQNPAYLFEQPGEKSISLKVRNVHGCEATKVLDAPLEVRGPVARFTPSATAICTLPALFAFTNNSTGDGTLSYEWFFSKDEMVTTANPTHAYHSAGSYVVTLRVRDASGCQDLVDLTVHAGNDDAVDFNASPTLACPGQPVTFTATSADPIASHEWAFDDGSTQTVMSPTFTASGNISSYNVTLTAQLLNHSCKSVKTKKIELVRPSVASFEKSLDCNMNLLLLNTSSHANRVEWYINDILLSTANKFTSPNHLPGPQTVKLIAYNAAGCAYEKEEVITLMTTPIARFTPNKSFTCKPGEKELAGCAPFTIEFVNTSTSTASTTWLWDFGDGSTSTAIEPDHTFTTKGTYQIKLTASNPNGCSTTAAATVKVSDAAPLPDFEVDKTLVCPGEIITFTDKSQNAEAWCWDFGDGWGAEGPIVAHGYGLPGTYTVTLTAKNGCSGVIKREHLITVKNPSIVFEFTKSCENPFVVELKNHSSNYDELEWDFGDGATSTQYDVPNHVYASEGEYLLKLTGRSYSTGCVATAVLPLTIQAVSADFSVDPAQQCAGQPVRFTDMSHAAVKWTWTMGPYTSRSKNFSAALFTPGDYVASLEVKDSDSCVAVKTVPIEVLNMKGDFSFSASSTCDEFIVDFRDESAGTPQPTSWLWEFGDGQSSTDQHPVHAYTSPGDYSVVLKISNAEGSCTFAKEDAVSFVLPAPGIAVAKSKFCLGETVTLANTSVNASGFTWLLGDGRSSSELSPQVVYAEPGSYSITLTVIDKYGCEKQVVKPNFVTIVKPVADFSVDKTSGSCPPFTASFQDKSAANIVSWQWAFGDGKTSTLQNPVNIYAVPGSFNVKLDVTDVNGCTASKEASQFVTVGGPSGLFAMEGWGACDSKKVAFIANSKNATKMTWDFGDGVVKDETATSLEHEYNSTGTFTPSLLLTDANGCKVLAVGSAEIIIRDTTSITTHVSPGCVFAGDPLRLVGETETDDALAWVWTVAGTQVAVGENTQTSFSEPGHYVLIGYAMNDFGCFSSVSTDVYVQGPISSVPNVITPNGDGYNQHFTFDGLDHSEWDLDVINRWGREVYTEKNYKGNWDGGDVPAGVYYFVLRNALCEGLDVKGVVSVVR